MKIVICLVMVYIMLLYIFWLLWYPPIYRIYIIHKNYSQSLLTEDDLLDCEPSDWKELVKSLREECNELV